MFEMSDNLKVITMRIGKKAGSSSFSAKKVKLFSVGEYSPAGVKPSVKDSLFFRVKVGEGFDIHFFLWLWLILIFP
jgi:hypothetical protein